jgi:two-component system response regulator GlrR
VHAASRRAERSFLAVNCSAIPEPLLESELFGHNKGSFTGATASHRGLFQAADGGSLFLDEIGDMPVSLQVKLLRVLQERQVRPVGSTESVRVDVRIISATHRDLQEAMKEGTFREDLYYRLNVVMLEVPPLRERREDIPLLARHFLQKVAEANAKKVREFSPEAMELLVSASWPGNVRQLYNLVEQTVVLATTPVIPVVLVEKALRDKPGEILSFAEARNRFERDYLAQILQITAGNVAEAARLAKRNRTEFYRLLRRHQLEPGLFKPARS